MKKYKRIFTVKELGSSPDASTVKIKCKVFNRKTGVELNETFSTRKSAKRVCKELNKMEV